MTMKAFTDISQGKKLAEILPIESADAYYTVIDQGFFLEVKQGIEPSKDDIPCWSLAALFNILPSATLDTSDDHYCRFSCQQRCTEWHDNPIDACYEMIIKLNELKML